MRYDALLVLSFGGPDGPDDIMPFLRNVTSGRGVPDERLAIVAEHYRRFGGVSPINGLNRDLVAAVQADFAARGIDLPVYWGNRNWTPYVGCFAWRRPITVPSAVHAVTTSSSGNTMIPRPGTGSPSDV